MSNKKQLNEEQLEKVSGGLAYRSAESINWMFTFQAPVKIKPIGSTEYIDAVVTRRGYYKNAIYYHDYYYLDCHTNRDLSDWYLSDYFDGNTVKAVNKDNGYVRDLIHVVEWK